MNEANTVSLNQEKCIGCGLCCKDCPSKVLELQNKKAVVLSQDCLKCGHCVSICPTSAFNMSGYDMDEIIEFDEKRFVVNEELLLNALKFRRSIRHYKTQIVERDKISKIIEAGRYTPTGSNKQNVRYIIVEKDIKMLEDAGINIYRKLKRFASIAGKAVKLPYDMSKLHLESGFLFQGAPILVLGVSKSNINASLAAMSMELMAEAQELGTLYVGLFTLVANRSSKIKKLLNLKKGENIVFCLAFGYPDIQYKRTAPRKKAEVEWR